MILALAGFFLLLRSKRILAAYFIIVFAAMCYLIGGDPTWDGLSSFGNRYFICLTPLFILGLAVSLQEFAKWLGKERRAMAIASSVIALLIIWNWAFIFQWGTHMVPARGPISWRQMVRNQFTAVPQRAGTEVAAYFEKRGALMHQIELEDVRQLKAQEGAGKKK